MAIGDSEGAPHDGVYGVVRVTSTMLASYVYTCGFMRMRRKVRVHVRTGMGYTRCTDAGWDGWVEVQVCSVGSGTLMYTWRVESE